MERLRKQMSTIRVKFLLLALLISVVPLLLLGTFAYHTAYHNLISSSEERAASNLYIVYQNLQSACRSMEMLARQILSDPLIVQSVNNHYRALPSASTADNTTRRRVYERLRKAMDNLTAPMPSTVYLFSNECTLLSSASNTGFASALVPDAATVRASDWYGRLLEKNGLESYYLFNVLSPDDNAFFSVTKLLRNLTTGESYGFIVINVSTSVLAELLPMAVKNIGISFAVADPASGMTRGVDSALDEETSASVLEYLKTPRAPGEWRSFASELDTRSGFHVVSIIDRDRLIRDNISIVAAMLIMMTALVAAAMVCSVVFARSITRQLSRLGNVIRKMEAGEALEEKRFDDDEVGQIGNAFLDMAHANHQLQERLVKLSIMEKEAEIKALQFQINPHFLYNTLSSIYWLCKLGQNDKAARVAVLLSDNFKYVIGHDCDLVSVEAELTHIRHYIELQNIRYNQSICVTWAIDESILNRRILKFILQPIVENAISHGLEPKINERALYIGGQIDHGDVLFEIRDNGVGIEDLGKVQKGYGTQNVMERIRLKYGNRYGLTIQSALGEGTTVFIRIPPDLG